MLAKVVLSWYFWPTSWILLNSWAIDSEPIWAWGIIVKDSTRKCLIHCTEETGDLTALNNAHSWKTHLQAAQIQQYQPILDLVHELKDDNIPVIYYHRKCRGTVYLPWRRILIGFVKLPRGKAAILNPWVNLERRSSPFFLARIACLSWPPKQSKLTVDAVQVFWQCMSISLYIADRKYGAAKVLFTKGAVPWELFWTRPCFGVTNGGVETPKHMFLPYAVKSLMNNVELIQIINLFGHGVSYLQIEELNTTLCLEKLAAIPENMIPLPDNIKPYNIPTSLACRHWASGGDTVRWGNIPFC